MKDFLKMMFASFTALLLFFVLGVAILIGSLVAIISMKPEPKTVADNSILQIVLNKPIQDRTPDNPFQFINPTSFSIDMPLGLNSIVKGIERAKFDPKIKGIYMNLNDMSAGLATTEEIRNAILDFRTSGKFVITSADNYSQLSYYLATASDKIYMNPYGTFFLYGMSSRVMFYKGLLDKLGVEMQIIRHGKFKAAVEPFMLDKMSPENKEQISTYMGSIWNSILQSISSTRHISMDSLRTITDKLQVTSGEEALNVGLMDALYYRDEVVVELCKLMQVKSEKELKLVGVSDYSAAINLEEKESKNKIAVIYASGEISQGNGQGEGIFSGSLSKVIRSARNDSTIKAIVFRVNSPGGDAQAAEIIARELELAKQVKPVIVSMGDVAASGGYWISMPSNAILANHTTITGSIGVFGMIPNFEKGMKDKLGLNVDVVKTNENSDLLNVFRPLTNMEKNILQKRVEDIYTKFINKVADSRKMTASQVDSLGQGRVWSGDNAFQNKLIDQFGGLQDAIKMAVLSSGVSEYNLVELPKEKSPFEMIMESFGSQVKSMFRHSELEKSFQHYEYVIKSVNNQGVQARIPYEIEIN